MFAPMETGEEVLQVISGKIEPREHHGWATNTWAFPNPMEGLSEHSIIAVRKRICKTSVFLVILSAILTDFWVSLHWLVLLVLYAEALAFEVSH